MRDTDLEKFKLFEEWLLDVGQEEKKTIERNGIISVIVKSGEWWRIFTSEAYSIRTIVVHLNRYCPDYSIVGIRYGLYPTKLLSNLEWRKLEKAEVTALKVYFHDFSNIGTKEQILATTAPYRDKVNLYYIKCSIQRVYPSKTPFRGIAVNSIPYEASAEYGSRVDHPFFVPDHESIYTEPSDILNHYDGKRVDKAIYGEPVKGYIIEKCRLQYKRKKD